MGFHTYDPARADRLEDPDRYRWCSAEELLALLSPSASDAVADLGSGTGFYTDDVASRVGTVYAVDVQPAMHALYAEKGMPSNVRPLTADVAALPLPDDGLDGAFSTMTYHEFSGAAAMAELARVVRPGGRLVTVDWTRTGSGVEGPPPTERHDLGHAVSAATDAGFTVERATSRSETFVCVGRR